MNYFITGSSGLVGSYFIDKLANTKNRVTCLIHHNKYLNPHLKNIKFVKGDLANYKSLVLGCKDADIIMHCAAAINVKRPCDYYLVNHQGTINLLKAALLNKVKLFIFFSSWAVNPKAGDYANSKLLAEKEVEKYPNYLIVRPGDLYSKTKGHLINFISIVKSCPFVPIVENGNYLISPLYLEDLYNAVSLLIRRKLLNQTVSVLGPKTYTFNQLIKLIMKQMNKNKPVVKLPKPLIYPVIYLTDKLNINFPLNIERYRRLTSTKVMEGLFNFNKNHLKPLHFEEGLKKYLFKS